MPREADPRLRDGLPALPADDPKDGLRGALALFGVPVVRLSLAQLVERERRRAPNPNAHRVFRPRRMPARYKREVLGELERETLARALVLPWVPEACPKCDCQVLRSRGVEVSCPLCGWCQMVRR